VSEQISGHAAKDPFSDTRMAIPARYDEIGAALLGYEYKLVGCGGLALGAHLATSLDLMTLQVTHHIRYPRCRRRQFGLRGDLNDMDAFRCREEG
jgi:hypothetical protein